jgi:hypothetical protein
VNKIVFAIFACVIIGFIWVSIPKKQEPISEGCIREMKEWSTTLKSVNELAYLSIRFAKANMEMEAAKNNVELAKAIFFQMNVPTCYDEETVASVQREENIIISNLELAFENIDQGRYLDAANLMISVGNHIENVRVYLDSFNHVIIEGE